MSGHDPRLRAALRFAPALAACLAYLPNLDDYFVSDDFDHPFLHGYSWEALWAHLSRPAAAGDFFRPLTRVSMWLDHTLWGATPEPSHVVNILLHAGTATVVAALGHRLTGRAAVGVLAGVLFAIHPIHPEAVAFLGARFDLLSGLFAAASLLTYARHAEGGSAWWLGASTALFLASILSKEAGLFVPPALLAYELICARERRLWRAGPSFAVLALYAIHRLFVIGATGGYQTALGESRHLPALDVAFVEQLLGFAGYGLVTPVNQLSLGGPALALCVALGALFLACTVTVLAARTTRWRTLLFCGVATLLAALPASSLYSVAGLTQGLEGARFLYVPSIPFCVLLAILLHELRPAALRATAIALQLALYGTLVILHALVWSHASDLTRGAVLTINTSCRDLPGPEPTVLVYGAPDSYQGAFVLRNGIPAAVERLHPQHAIGRFVRSEIEPDFHEASGFDIRDAVGRPDVCALRWDPETDRLVDATDTLRRASRRTSPDDELPAIDGLGAWEAWTLTEAETEPSDGSEWVIYASGEDPQLERPVPLDVREVRLTMRVTPEGEVAAPLGELFWAVDDVPFATPGAHHRLFEVHVDGEPHEYRLPIPLGYPDELEGARLRLRIDPTIFAARITLDRIELVRRPLGPPPTE